MSADDCHSSDLFLCADVCVCRYCVCVCVSEPLSVRVRVCLSGF